MKGSIVAIAAVVLIGCGDGERDGTVATADSRLGRTSAGAVYHRETCVDRADSRPLVTFAPGTGVTPDRSTLFVRHLGDRTGWCVVAIPYENTELVASCCTTTDTPQGPQDPDCLLQVIGAKAAAEPQTMVCTSDKRLTVPGERSVEGGILLALQQLEMDSYLSGDGAEVRWDRLILTGHSQGAQLSKFIALTRRVVAGVGSFGGGVLPVTGPRSRPEWVYDARTTNPAVFRAFHHANDADDFRREVYEAIGIPSENIRLTDNTRPECQDNPHSCVIVDPLVPLDNGVPVFVEEWAWAVGAESAAGGR